jgi:glycosyltransferase involved in cell wall biosynthesis
MIVGIDASNLRGGGGLTHLRELLAAAEPEKQGVQAVIVWGARAGLDLLPERSWLEKRHQPWLDRSLAYRAFWQRRQLPRLARHAGCSVLFCPGGLAPGDFRPVVAMCQNLLPFEWSEMRRYGISWVFLRLLLLRWMQLRTFRRAEGVVFLTSYAQQRVITVAGALSGETAIIPHGVNEQFFCAPRPPRWVERACDVSPFRIVYVSVVDAYKHQWHVAEAVAQLRTLGLPVELALVGPAYPPAYRRLEATMRSLDPAGAFIRYRGFVPYDRLAEVYRQADLSVFASSCENLPNILLEAMAAGLPIACSNRGPMREVLGEAGVYFEPEIPEDIARALRGLIESPKLRAEKARMAFERAKHYSWRRCADETFSFLATVAKAAPTRRAQDVVSSLTGRGYYLEGRVHRQA